MTKKIFALLMICLAIGIYPASAAAELQITPATSLQEKSSLTINDWIIVFNPAWSPVTQKSKLGTLFAADSELAAFAGLTSAANKIPYFTGAGTMGVISSSADMISLLAAADYAAARGLLGVSSGGGTGTVDIEGAPALHYWGVWYDNNTLKAVSVAGSSVVCTDANGEPTPCTGLTPTQINLDKMLVESSAAAPTEQGEIKHHTTSPGSTGRGGVYWNDGVNDRELVDIGNDSTLILKEEYLPIRYFEEGTVAPSPAAAIGTGGPIARSFSEGDSAYAFWNVPKHYHSGLKYQVVYGLSQDALVNETVIFSLTGCSVINGGVIACTPGTPILLTDELGTANDTTHLMITDYSEQANSDWNIVAGGQLKIVLSNTDSDYTGEPKIVGIRLQWFEKILGVGSY